MFGAWSKPKFHTKCKSALRHMRTRLEQVKKKRLAVEKFLKSDIADLLNGGLDYNAYLKADILLIEQNITACYDLVEQFCGCISDHLSDMVKESECPEECREAAASLIYAAARFADLPELRQLRSLFTGKYGNSLEYFANKEFVQKFKANPPSKDMKLRLMQDAAQEFSIDWDSKSLEQKLFTPPLPQQEQPKYSPPGETNDIWHNNKNDMIPKRGAPASNELAENRFKLRGNEESQVTNEPRRGGRTDPDNQQQSSSPSTGSFTEDDIESNRRFYYRFIRPPYTRPRATNTKEPSDDIDGKEKNQSSNEPKPKPKARSVKRWISLRRENVGTGSPDGKQRASENTNQGDEEERILDRLLRYYSKKKSHKEEGQAKEVAEAAIEESGESWKGHRATKSMSAAEAESSARTRSEGKTHGRASSLDLGGHVHPSLPNYNELAARIAALREI